MATSPTVNGNAEGLETDKEDKGKEKAKRFPAGVPLDGVFAMDPVKEAQLAREREALKSDTKSSGRKLSKRR